jgi:CRISPR-associated endonuclease/helicase Cas3
VSQFADVYRALHGYDPFRWQERAATELADGVVWPALVAPTASGKTTLIECWLYARSIRADLPRRLFWVVDRRGVVDQVAAYACGVVDELAAAPSNSPAAAVREGLRTASGGLDPVVRVWRGALDDEDAAAESREPLPPHAIAIVCSTIDQVGSRLLFDGYGIAPRSRALHAGLVGIDSLIVLDEAHLPAPFLQTLRLVAEIQGERNSVRPVRAVPITATPRSGSHAFTLASAELKEGAISRRIRASKPTRLEPLRRGTQAEALIRAAQPLLLKGAVLGVVANTVRDARDVHDAFAHAGTDRALLVIGPSRPLDRAPLLGEIPTREERKAIMEAVVVVGTQTLEVGLDIDFDALVSACAPLPALVQRFGRVDRVGALGRAEGVIVEPPRRCPVYGEATAQTWAWLNEITDGLDFGVNPLRDLLASRAPPEPEPPPHTPLLLLPHVETLRMTRLSHPWPPETALFLRGEADHQPEVQLGWRDDLAPGREREWPERVLARPPHPGELVSLPLGALRRWLQGGEAAAFADVEGSGESDAAATDGRRGALRVRPPGPDGERTIEIVGPDELRPGDVLLVPAAYGGCDRFGWAPESTDQVVDLGSLSRRRARVLVRASASGEIGTLVPTTRQALDRDEISREDAYRELRASAQAWLEAGADLPERHQKERARLISLPETGEAIPVGETDLVLAGRRPRQRKAGTPVLYYEHAAAVEERTLSHADLCGVSPAVASALGVAARYHDLGKLDKRFQAWLGDGSQDPSQPLAKSGGRLSPKRIAEAREASGWPQGKRHELLSAVLLARAAPLGDGIDDGLVQHLVTTHHGLSRPFFEVVPDDSETPVPANVEGRTVEAPANALPDWPSHVETMNRLEDELGIWGLAYLEALLVLADRAVSAAEGAG